MSKIIANYHLDTEINQMLHNTDIVDAAGREFHFSKVDKAFAETHDLVQSNLKFWYPSLYFVRLAADSNPNKSEFSLEFLDEKGEVSYGYVNHDTGFDLDAIKYIYEHFPSNSYSNLTDSGRDYIEEYVF
ncbi:MAG: hypothetical protein J0G32_01065 [Alphaproteobacteria bacterium]|nr:hypothetical protein [Alphaproteobacteria bacterium]OJV13208.1 MAG: hypothetical protein BGO27_00185 [Alphaproteobacteria bacterium 33-17]